MSNNFLNNKQMLASKYLIDEGESEEIYNSEWAKASELPVDELNKLERSFLRQMV
jgi:hypothetical protein